MTADGVPSIHTWLIDTSKISLHIPPSEGWQLPRERRAVGAAKADASLVFRTQTPEAGFLSGFSRGGG